MMAVDGLILAARSHPAPVDVMVFAVSAVIVLAGAIGVVTSRNPVHSALFLVMTLFGIAVLFVEQEAHLRPIFWNRTWRGLTRMR